MSKMMKLDSRAELPAPIALTPDQLKQVATETAGGLTIIVVIGGPVIHPPVIRAGGISAQ